MAKNITISVPDELAKQMEKFRDVNWSEVCRSAIGRYVETRSHPNIEAIISKLRKEFDEDFALGYKSALEFANKTSYRVLDDVYKDIDEDLTIENWRNYWENINLDWSLGEDAFELVEESTSTAFIKGFFKGLIEIHNKIHKKD